MTMRNTISVTEVEKLLLIYLLKHPVSCWRVGSAINSTNLMFFFNNVLAIVFYVL